MSPIRDTIRVVGSRIEIFGVLIIVAGMFGTPICICDGRRLGTVPSFLLEVLVAADIVKSIAHELSFVSLGLLAGPVSMRTFF